MDKNKAPVFTLSIVSIIVGVALFKQFDFENLKFDKPWLAFVYAVVLMFSIYVLIKNVLKK